MQCRMQREIAPQLVLNKADLFDVMWKFIPSPPAHILLEVRLLFLNPAFSPAYVSTGHKLPLEFKLKQNLYKLACFFERF